MKNVTQMFRLKLAYQAENQETGDVEKIKTEVLVQCVNYTDAETLLNKVIEHYDMAKLAPVVYEIVKCKFTCHDIYFNSLTNCDSDDVPLTCGRLNCFFSDDSYGLYSVDTIVFGDKSLKEKDVKTTYLIPATDPADATVRAKLILADDGNDEEDIAVTNVKYDKAGDFYLEPMTYTELIDRSIKIFENHGL